MDNSKLKFLIESLKNSKKPLILGGHGVKLSDSEDIFKLFVNKNNFPTILSWSAIDLLSYDNVNNFGNAGVMGRRSSNIILQECDLLLVLGSRLSLLQTGYDRSTFAPNALIIHIDLDSFETKKFNKNYFTLNLNVKDVLLELLKHNFKADPFWWTFCSNVRSKYPVLEKQHLEDPNSSYVFINKLSLKLDNDYTIVTDMGTALLSGFYGWRIKKGQKMFTSLGLGEMGYGLPAAIGAAFGGSKVLCLNCDGGMMMNLQELQTIKGYDLPIKIVIFNNNGYLMIKHTQKMLFKDSERTSVDNQSGLSLPEYRKIAIGFGIPYYKYDKDEDIDLFLSEEGPSILEVYMDPEQEFTPKVKGYKLESGEIVAGKLENMYPYEK